MPKPVIPRRHWLPHALPRHFPLWASQRVDTGMNECVLNSRVEFSSGRELKISIEFIESIGQWLLDHHCANCARKPGFPTSENNRLRHPTLATHKQAIRQRHCQLKWPTTHTFLQATSSCITANGCVVLLDSVLVSTVEQQPGFVFELVGCGRGLLRKFGYNLLIRVLRLHPKPFSQHDSGLLIGLRTNNEE
jgi:hypothetical protein